MTTEFACSHRRRWNYGYIQENHIAARSAMVVLGTYNGGRSKQLLLPLNWTPAASDQPRKVFKICALIQLGGARDVTCLNRAQKLDMKLWESHSDGSLEELFQE